jgi:GTP diphosphokinase / guanosine-3',5'-bis(diphosphate) 3'-diphosphatase
MELSQVQLETERKEILSKYKGLLRAATRSKTTADRKRIRKAFDIALDAHKDMRRKSGEPYIYHPIAVAKIVAEEIRLDTTAIVCALLHDTVEDTYISLEDIERHFGHRERKIIDGLTKISGLFDPGTSAQAENYRKMLLTLSDDVRVILIKIADRLHNMRTLDHMRRDKQLKIAHETLYMYAPLAHRLGLYAIKTELEDLALKYSHPADYEDITSKIQKTKAVRTRFINSFIAPFERRLLEDGFRFEIKGRLKSIYSIWNKIHKKHVPFEEIYDIFAIRVIIETKPELERADVWRVYSIVTDFYQPKPDRLRDWVTFPKSNGYESLHTTVMSPTGKWVEVQIRTRRMDEIAEMGFAAHWKYKGNQDSQSELDKWLSEVREVLENGKEDAIEQIDNIKYDLQREEIFVFTPKGELKKLPQGATTLDFAYHIHTAVGNHCIGAKVNTKLVPLNHVLRSGDQVEILTSKRAKPSEDWLQFSVMNSSKGKIRAALKDEKKKIADEGKDMLRRRLRNLKAPLDSINITELEKFYGLEASELYFLIANNRIDLKKIKPEWVEKGRLVIKKTPAKAPEEKQAAVEQFKALPKDTLLIGDRRQKLDFKLAPCCQPIPGDEVFAYVTVSEGIKVHRVNCPNAEELLGKFHDRVMRAVWANQAAVEFEAGLRFTGIDDVGLVNRITNIISADMNVNMKAIYFESDAGMFNGKIKVMVYDTKHLQSLMENLRNVPGIKTIERFEWE